MGRGKLNMELISSERARMITYHKRKKGLVKKAREFHILCDVDACVIIFGPQLGNDRPVDVETWPSDRAEVLQIINKFRANNTERKKNQDLSDFFVARKKKVDDEIAKMRKAYLKAKFPVWDNRLNLLPLDQLRVLASVLDTKLELAKVRLLKMKNDLEESRARIGGGDGPVDNNQSSVMASTFANTLFQKNLELEFLNQQPLSCMKPLDMQLPTFYPSDQPLNQVLPLNASPFNNNPVLTMLMNDPDFSQFGAVSSSDVPQATAKSQLYYDPTAGMLGNVMFPNNLTAQPVSYYGRTNNKQPMLPYMQQGSPILNNAPQMRMPQLSDFFDISEFEMEDTKKRF